MRPPEKMFRTIWHMDEKYVCVRDYIDHLRRAADMVEMMVGVQTNSSEAVLDTINTTIWHMEQL